MMPCEHGYYGLCPQCVREERDELRSRVAKLERERDQLALSLSATRAERDHAVRSAELWESEHRAGYEAMGVYKHLWLEGLAIMAVCGYFSRMRGPDLQVAYKQFGGGYTRRFLKSEDAVRAHRDDGYEITPFYAGSAPVPAVDTRLTDMEARKDAAYFERNQVVAALAKCFPSIVTQTEIPGWSSDWHGCVYIQLPTGQVSWHFHESQMYLLDGIPVKGAGWDGWDGHDTEEKYRRLNALPVPAAQADDVERDYPEGWVFHSADFSLSASCQARSGRVTLVRDLAGRDWWLSLSDEYKERVPLFVYGSGNTLSEAIKDASMLAAKAKGGAK